MQLDEFIVMPNHCHMIVVIADKPGAHPHTLSDMIGAFKSISTNQYIQGVKHSDWPRFNKRIWQRNFGMVHFLPKKRGWQLDKLIYERCI
jgi:REP element-mobilizing transposase RayT